jgi:PIN domain nuclease of toxin-antitoxin system
MGTALRLLLDTQVFYWWAYDKAHISPRALTAIKSSEEVLISLVTYWEIAIKQRTGKMKAFEVLAEGPSGLPSMGFNLLRIDYRHITGTLQLPLHHRDPFDRLLLSQAKTEGVSLVSTDTMFDQYEIKRLW